MMPGLVDAYRKAIVLTPRETLKYSKIAHKVGAHRPEEKRNPVYSRVLASKRYSFDFKRKLVFHMPKIRQGRFWGLSTFSGHDLYELVDLLLFEPVYEFIEEDMALLASNPALIDSAGEEFDTFRLFLKDRTYGSRQRQRMRNRLIVQALEDKRMNLKIAEAVIDANYDATSMITSKVKRRLDDECIIEWARKTYSLEDVPELWVRKFLGEEN